MPSEPIAPLFPGRFSDGQSATSVAAAVRLGPEGLEISTGEFTPPLVWGYDRLAVGVPLTARAIDALVFDKDKPGQSVFVAEGTFARQLAQRVPRLRSGRQRWASAAPLLALSALVFAAAGAIQVLDLSPFRAIAAVLPDETRIAIGANVVNSMTAGRRVCTDTAGRAALDTMLKRLTAASPGKTPFKVTVVDWGLVNAFAVPGEQIVMTRGLLAKAESPDEVAGVLGHEIGHGLELHPETGVLRVLGMSAALDLMMGGQSGAVGSAGILLTQFSYSRDAERQADGHALRLLREAKISPKGLGQFFRRVGGRPRGGATKSEASRPRPGWDILSTHPQTSERLARIDAEPAYEATPALDAEAWKALREICGPPPASLPPPAPVGAQAPAEPPTVPPQAPSRIQGPPLPGPVPPVPMPAPNVPAPKNAPATNPPAAKPARPAPGTQLPQRQPKSTPRPKPGSGSMQDI